MSKAGYQKPPTLPACTNDGTFAGCGVAGECSNCCAALWKSCQWGIGQVDLACIPSTVLKVESPMVSMSAAHFSLGV